MNVTDEELLADVFNAYFSARRNKRNTLAQLKFEINLEANLIKLYEELRNRTYKPLPCTCFITDDPVKREIFSSEFSDRIVHHLLYNYISPIVERRMIYNQLFIKSYRQILMSQNIQILKRPTAIQQNVKYGMI